MCLIKNEEARVRQKGIISLPGHIFTAGERQWLLQINLISHTIYAAFILVHGHHQLAKRVSPPTPQMSPCWPLSGFKDLTGGIVKV